jgi:hypothetical protein
MMNHYFFIRQLAFELDQQLRGATIEQLLSSSKDELFFQFKKEDKSHQLRLNWETNLSLLQFLTDTEHLPRQYEKQLFDAWGGVVGRGYATESSAGWQCAGWRGESEAG